MNVLSLFSGIGGFGLAQRRKRVFIVASFGDPRGCTLLLEPESVRRDSAQSRQSGQGDTGGIAHGTDDGVPRVSNILTTNEGRRYSPDNETLLPTIAHRSVDIANALTSVGRRPDINHAGNFVTTYAIQGNIVDREWGGAHGTCISINAPMYTLTSTDRHAVGTLWEAKGFDSCRIASDQECAPTLSARMGTGGNNTPLIGVRRLTPTECERLQGFPDGWTEGQSDSQRYKQLGNAVAVPVAEWIGRRILTAVLR